MFFYILTIQGVINIDFLSSRKSRGSKMLPFSDLRPSKKFLNSVHHQFFIDYQVDEGLTCKHFSFIVVSKLIKLSQIEIHIKKLFIHYDPVFCLYLVKCSIYVSIFLCNAVCEACTRAKVLKSDFDSTSFKNQTIIIPIN